ncbi:MAG TPA: pilus assembly protein [Ideonella sp.]|uniref:Flp family type IVb pilin n=1 Tax=Ideonella sp. TaxID=1929293 RepID=UPI002E2F6168|nr:pilus assembly protein [Ideonella sp.]HEX5684674.1 pilus assembly protein [Ideonella sp.]
MKLFANKSQRHARGQGMTEYIIIVALIAVAAIGVYNLFGATVRNQTAGMAAALGGAGTDAQKANKKGVTNGKESVKEASETKSLENFTAGATVKPK